MPSTCCCVPQCCGRGGHVFPKDKLLNAKWIAAIRRVNSDLTTWKPSPSSVVCKAHFTVDDYNDNGGSSHVYRHLKNTAIPSQFPWTREATLQQKSRAERRERRSLSQKASYTPTAAGATITSDVEVMRDDEMIVGEVVTIDDNVTERSDCDVVTNAESQTPTPILIDTETQTPTNTPKMDIHNFCKDDARVHFYTGLETYVKFIFILNSLGPAAYHLNYTTHQIINMTVPNQFFMVMMKLRRHTTNYELSWLFSVSETSVSTIIITWIYFMYHQWREINIWPNRNLVNHFTPSDFKRKFPSTRVIIDGTECPVKVSKSPRIQQATFSTYKNRNTIKILVGSTPGGLVSFVTPAYGGSTSDRQLVERSALKTLCESGDSIMCDKGFNVQDMFVTSNVMINMPTFFSKRNRMRNTTVLKDRKVSSKRVHIERIIGLAKTFAILREPINSTEMKMASEITFVCFMLCNFKKCIVSKHA